MFFLFLFKDAVIGHYTHHFCEKPDFSPIVYGFSVPVIKEVKILIK